MLLSTTPRPDGIIVINCHLRLRRFLWCLAHVCRLVGLCVCGLCGWVGVPQITGPGSPSVLSNMIVSIEQHVEWISQCIKHTRESGHTVVEATQDAEEAWVTEVNEVSKSGIGGMIIAHPSCASWYLGANIPGKPRVFMP